MISIVLKLLDYYRSIITRSPSIFYVIGIVSLANGFVMPLLEIITKHITKSYFLVSLGESLFIFALASMGLVWGILFDAVTQKSRLLFVALLLASLFIYLTSTATLPLEYIVYRLLTGFSVSAVYAYAIIIIKQKFPPGKRMGILLFFLAFGAYSQAIGAIITVLLHDVYGWRVLIRAFSAILFVGAFPILKMHTQTASHAQEKPVYNLLAFISKRTNIFLSLQGFFGSIPWAAFGLFFLYAIQEKINCGFLFAGLLVGIGGVLPLAPFLGISYLDSLRRQEHYSVLAYASSLAIFLQSVLIYVLFNIPTGSLILATRQTFSFADPIGSILQIFRVDFIPIIAVLVMFTNISLFPGPITRNVLIDVNSVENISSSLMTLRLFEPYGQSIGLIIGGLILEFTKSFIISLEVISISWLISSVLWIIISKTYPKDIKK